jgi:hypothetical protein
MNSEVIAVVARHLERLLIVLSGALAIVLGYRMFLAMPRRSEKGEGKLEMPGGISIYVTRVGPGVFFAMFGAAILGYGLYRGLSVEVREQRPGVAAPGAAGVAATTVVTDRKLSSALPAGASPEEQARDRTVALDTVGQLGRLATALDGAGGRALSQPQRLDFGAALTDARLRLLASVWDEGQWGPYTEFTAWVQSGESGPAPARAAPAARAYRGQR